MTASLAAALRNVKVLQELPVVQLLCQIRKELDLSHDEFHEFIRIWVGEE